jgi:hypothetical protein
MFEASTTPDLVELVRAGVYDVSGAEAEEMSE